MQGIEYLIASGSLYKYLINFGNALEKYEHNQFERKCRINCKLLCSNIISFHNCNLLQKFAFVKFIDSVNGGI